MKRNLMPWAVSAAMMAAAPSAVIGRPRADAGGADVAALLRDVKSQLEQVGSDVRKTAETAMNEAKRAGSLSDETKASADRLLTQQTVLQAAVDKLEQRLGETEAQNRDMEQRLAGRRQGGSAPAQSLGAMVSANDEVRNFAKVGAKGSVMVTVQNAITSGSASAGSLISPQRETEIVGLPRRQTFIRDLLSTNTTTSNLIWYAKQLARSLNAAVVAEGALKPESNLTYTSAEAPVRTIAHWIPVSRQALDDATMLQGEIDSELIFGLDLAEEAEILNGAGGTDHLAGLIPAATAYGGTHEPAGATAIDRLRFAILEASLALYPADGIVMHEIEWAKIEVSKDMSGWYLVGNPLGILGPTLWGKRVVATAGIAPASFLVGAFKAAATIYDRMDTEVLISSEDRDNFVKNMLTIRAEKRLALAIKRPGALIKGTLEFED